MIQRILISVVVFSSFTACNSSSNSPSSNNSTQVNTWVGTKTLSADNGIVQVQSVHVDVAQNLYLAGDVELAVTGISSVTMYGNTFKNNDNYLTKFDASGNQVWTKPLSAPGTTVSPNFQFDPQGNLVFAGYSDTQTSLIYELTQAKFDPNGNLISEKDLGMLGVPNAVTEDANGNFYVFGENNHPTNQAYLTYFTAFVAKFDPQGNLLWKNSLGLPNSFTWASGSITVDSSGNVIASGQTEGGINGPTLGVQDAYVVKFDPNGNQLWMKSLGSPNAFNYSSGVALDSAQNIYAFGNTSGGTLNGSTVLQPYQWGEYLAKYDPAGNLLWIKVNLATPDPNDVSAVIYTSSIAIDSANHVWVAGYSEGPIDQSPFSGSENAYLKLFDTNGDHLWTQSESESQGRTRAQKLTTDAYGFVYEAGWADGTGTDDIVTYISKYAPDGTKE